MVCSLWVHVRWGRIDRQAGPCMGVVDGCLGWCMGGGGVMMLRVVFKWNNSNRGLLFTIIQILRASRLQSAIQINIQIMDHSTVGQVATIPILYKSVIQMVTYLTDHL